MGSEGEVNTNSMGCAKLMEFIYISRLKVWEQVEKLNMDVNASSGTSLEWKAALRTLSRASSLMFAHAHILAAVASQRPECFSEHVRILLIVNLRRMKALTTKQFKQLWSMGQDGPNKSEQLSKQLRDWLS